jgi:L-asparagine transporter-like permease
MYNNYLDILVAAHSGGRWIVLLLLLVAIFRSVSAGNRNFTNADQKVGLFLMIFTDLMLLVGLILYFAGNWGTKQIENFGGMSELMKNPTARFFSVEHLAGMLIAIVLIHIGKAQGKKDLPHNTKHRRTAIFYILALLIIVASIPWPIREVGEGRGWF